MGALRRNAPCHCGSGKKYKRCHGSAAGAISQKNASERTTRELLRQKAKLVQREAQQGLGRPIISATVAGYRLVAVGKTVHWSKKWLTFHDFLIDYVSIALGAEWGNTELRKPLAERHPVLQWYDIVCGYQKETIKEPGKVSSAITIGAAAAYLHLGYNLYLIAHNGRNEKLRLRLIARLKDRRSFHGAYYETFVAAAFIKAGFKIEFEDERDSASSHCEFTATSRDSGRKFSVEAKARHTPGSLGVDEAAGTIEVERIKIGHQLYRALKKKADHSRVVFIDVNVPDPGLDTSEVRWFKPALDVLREKESGLTIDGVPAPSAYIFVTNHPYHHSLHSKEYRWSAFADGFKISDFRAGGVEFPTLGDALAARKSHQEMFGLMASLRKHYEIPSTFDGEIPEFAFEDGVPRLVIGQQYLVPDADGQEVLAELMDAIVLEGEKKIHGIYRLLDNSKSIICQCPITEPELAAYRRHPETFFGSFTHVGVRTEDPIVLYDSFFETYRQSSKEKLLDFMSQHSDIERLRRMTQEDLAKIYCERLVSSIMRDNARRRNGGSDTQPAG